MRDHLLSVPPGATGLVIFAHGSGSSRLSPRNRFVADILNGQFLATLLFDLLTPEEEAVDVRTAEFRFNIPLLAERLTETTLWAAGERALRDLPIGYFGASTGAGAAIVAAARLGEVVRAVVSRGGRPDLARTALSVLKAPTLLIVGKHDEIVEQLNRDAAAQMRAPHEITIVPGAGHLFEEPGTLAEAGRRAAAWFKRYLGPLSSSVPDPANRQRSI